MLANSIIIGAALLAQLARGDSNLRKFMGREVTITGPERDPDGSLPNVPASVCLEGPPQRQCYTAPEGFGGNAVTVVQLRKNVPALLFTTSSGGVSGWSIHFALLRPGTGKDLRDLF